MNISRHGMAVGWGAAAVVLITGMLAGCAPTAPPVPAPTGVSVTISQERLYIARGEAAINVQNAGSDAITLTSVAYSTPSLADPVTWAGQQPIPAGSTRSIRFMIPASNCSGDATAGGTAQLGFATAGGAASAAYSVTDPYDFLGRHSTVTCFSQLLDATASVQLTDVTTRQTNSGLVAVMTVTAKVTGQQAIRIESLKSTTLLQPAGGGWTWAPATTVDAGGTATVELEAVPARCDLHAIAEDKVGTRFDTTVTILGDPAVTGTITLVATDAQKGALYDYVVAACGPPPVP